MSPLTPRLGVSGCSSGSPESTLGVSEACGGVLSPEVAPESSSSSEWVEDRVAAMERANQDIAASTCRARGVGGGSECARSGECDSRRKDQINVCPIRVHMDKQFDAGDRACISGANHGQHHPS
jgi:hypothetical protein